MFMTHKLLNKEPELCRDKFSAEFREQLNLKPHWLVKTVTGRYYMDTVFQKEQVQYFVPDSTDFIVYEFIKTETKKRSRIFQCTFDGCNKVKVSLSKYFQHYVSHSKDKPYACHHEGCDWKFGYVGNLKKHLQDVHNED